MAQLPLFDEATEYRPLAKPTCELIRDMRTVLSDMLTMPDFDGTLTTSVKRASVKRRARALIKEATLHVAKPERETCGGCGAPIEAWDKVIAFEDQNFHDFCCE